MKIEHIALYVKDLETARDFLWKKPLAAAISPGRALEDISGENQDAASFNRFAAAFVYCLHGGSLPPCIRCICCCFFFLLAPIRGLWRWLVCSSALRCRH